METWQVCIGSICAGLFLGLGILIFLSLRKSRGANSNYTEFPIDESNFPMTWKDKGNYD